METDNLRSFLQTQWLKNFFSGPWNFSMTITTILLCIILESDNGSLNTIIIIMITIIIIIRMLVNTCELIGQHNHQALITEQFELHLSQNNIRMANHTLFWHYVIVQVVWRQQLSTGRMSLHSTCILKTEFVLQVLIGPPKNHTASPTARGSESAPVVQEQK